LSMRAETTLLNTRFGIVSWAQMVDPSFCRIAQAAARECWKSCVIAGSERACLHHGQDLGAKRISHQLVLDERIVVHFSFWQARCVHCCLVLPETDALMEIRDHRIGSRHEFFMTHYDPIGILLTF